MPGQEQIDAIVQRARGGDSQAFGDLFSAFDADVDALCRRMLGRSAASQDARNEVFLRARRAFESFDAERPVRPWLLGIASHYCIDQLRRRSRESRIFDARDLADDDLAAPGPSPLSRLQWAEERSSLLSAIESLPDRYRLPIVLRYWNEFDYAAIAEILNVSPAQVGTLLYRAKRKLRERLAQGGVP